MLSARDSTSQKLFTCTKTVRQLCDVTMPCFLYNSRTNHNFQPKSAFKKSFNSLLNYSNKEILLSVFYLVLKMVTQKFLFLGFMQWPWIGCCNMNVPCSIKCMSSVLIWVQARHKIHTVPWYGKSSGIITDPTVSLSMIFNIRITCKNIFLDCLRDLV